MSTPADRKTREAAASREIDRLHDADEARVLRGLLRFPPAPGPAVRGGWRPICWASGRGAPLSGEQFAAAQRLAAKGLIVPTRRGPSLAGWDLTPAAAKLAEGVDLADAEYRRPAPAAADVEQPALFPVAA